MELDSIPYVADFAGSARTVGGENGKCLVSAFSSYRSALPPIESSSSM
jgi:hypothetical protein